MSPASVCARVLQLMYRIDTSLYYGLQHQSKEEGKDQVFIQSKTTPDPGHHMGK